MSSGSRLTLHNCEMCYYQQLIISHDYRSKFTSGSIFTQGQWRGAYSQFLYPFFIRVNIYPATLYYNISRRQYLPCGGGGSYCKFFNPFILSGSLFTLRPNPTIFKKDNNTGHYLPCKIYCLILACKKAIVHIRPVSFCHGKSNI